MRPLRASAIELGPRVFSNVGEVRGSRGGDVPIQRRGRDAKAVRGLRYADIGIGEHRKLKLFAHGLATIIGAERTPLGTVGERRQQLGEFGVPVFRHQPTL